MKKLDFNVDLKKIGFRLSTVRGRLKQTEFARELGINLTTYRNYEEGRNIPLEFIIYLHKKCNISLNWLLTGEGRMEHDPIDPGQVVSRKDIPLYMITSYIKHIWTVGFDKERNWFEVEFERHFPEYTKWVEKKEREKKEREPSAEDTEKKTA